MPAASKRKQGQRDRRDRESKLEPAERTVLLHELSQTPEAVAARAARPREDGFSAEERRACRRRKRRVKAWMTRREDEEPRTERAPATTWLLLPSDVLTVARCDLASLATFPPHMSSQYPPSSRQLA